MFSFSRPWPAPVIAIIVASVFVLAACSSRDDAIVVIAAHPTKSNILYVATNQYIYKTRDEGRTWEKMSGGMSHSRVIAIAVDPSYPATLYAGTKGDAVYKSYDGGHSWVAQKTGLDDVTITSVVNYLVFEPTDVNHLFAATTMGIFESLNGGETWKKRMDGMKEILMVATLAIDPIRPTVMYAGTSGGVYRSVDGARHWEKANNGLVSPDLLSSSRALMVNAIVIDTVKPESRGETIYTATLNGLYKTTDAAKSWFRIGANLPDQMIIAIAVDRDGALYAAGRKGVYKSIDYGASWKAINNGLQSLNIRSLVISPSAPGTMYVGTNGTGLYRSRDGGEHWDAVPLVLTRPSRA